MKVLRRCATRPAAQGEQEVTVIPGANATRDEFSFHYSDLETVHCGTNYCTALQQELESRGLKRALVIVSSSLLKRTEQLSELQRVLGDRLVGVSDCVGAHTPRPDVMRIVEQARSLDADVLISIGGGSVIDGCKAAQLALAERIDSEADLVTFAQHADGTLGSNAGSVRRPASDYPVRQIAVPTTMSGAEYSNNAGVLNPEIAAKEGYRAPGLCPQVIIYDPELSLHTPEWLWMSTAIRSLDHATEGLCSSDCTPFLAGHFLHALRLFAEALPRVKVNPADLPARNLAQQAVWLACCGLGTVAHGASHGIGYILGSYCSVPHGYTSCVMLPAVLTWNRDVLGERDREIAAALGRPDGSAGEAVAALISSLDLPATLRDVGVETDQLPEIARRASVHRVVRKNPRAITAPESVTEILQLAW